MTSSFSREHITPATRVTLERGKQEAEVQLQQVTVENLRRLFQVSDAARYSTDKLRHVIAVLLFLFSG